MSESMLKRVLSAIRGKQAEESEPVSKEKEGYFSEVEKTAILGSFAKEDALMERFEKDEIDAEEMERELRRIERDRMRRLANADLEDLTKVIAKDARAFPAPASVEESPKKTKPNIKRFKFDGRIGWAWQVENSVANNDVNDLLKTHEQPVELGRYIAEQVFKSVARRAGEAGELIDEDGTDVLLPCIPHSPYTDEGAALMVSLAYTWRSMAEEWNMIETQRQKERKDKEAKERAEELSNFLRTSVDEMIKTELARKEAMKDRSDELDAQAFARLTVKPTDFAKTFSAVITPEESSGVSKIAAGLSMGQLPKSKF